MFVGEAPGHDEDIQGIPFVGRAGQLLTKIIEAIGLAREDVYIANVIKCRPPENRNPEPDEVATCEPFLFRQVQVDPAARSSSRSARLPRRRCCGRRTRFPGSAAGSSSTATRSSIPTFHPAYLLRNPERKRDVWEDMKKVRALLQGDADDTP